MRRAGLAIAVVAIAAAQARGDSGAPIDGASEVAAPSEPAVVEEDVGAAPIVRRTPLRWESTYVQVAMVSDGWRWELGTGVSAGWRTLADLRFRKYGNDAAVSAGARLGFDLDGLAPRLFEAELGARIARGKLLLPGDVLARLHVMLTWGTGAARLAPERYALIGFAGVGFRVIPSGMSWLLVEVGVRESYAPHVESSTSTARTATAATYTRDVAWSFATEASVGLSVLWPRPRMVCRFHHVKSR